MQSVVKNTGPSQSDDPTTDPAAHPKPASGPGPMKSIVLVDVLLAIGEAMAGNPELQAQSINDWLVWQGQEVYDPKGLIEARGSLGQHCLAADD